MIKMIQTVWADFDNQLPAQQCPGCRGGTAPNRSPFVAGTRPRSLGRGSRWSCAARFLFKRKILRVWSTWTYCSVRADLPTPPSPSTTIRYLRCMMMMKIVMMLMGETSSDHCCQCWRLGPHCSLQGRTYLSLIRIIISFTHQHENYSKLDQVNKPNSAIIFMI